MSRQRADILLVERGFFDSRARARAAIEAGLVTADGETVLKPAQPIPRGALIVANPPHPYVSRGGVKLAAALDHFALSPSGLVCLDCGASTGGFTDVLLKRGAAYVTAVDTGRDQLHQSLRSHPRVTALEGTDIRKLEPSELAQPPAFLACDVSFISLALVLPALTRLAAAAATFVCLVKPQFEVGREGLGKGGIVRDGQAALSALARIEDQAEALGWRPIGRMPSPITGGDGNREFLMAARR